MPSPIKLSILIFFLFIGSQSFAQRSPDFLDPESTAEFQALQFKMGFNLGWSFPYSAGLEFSLLFSELIDVNMGVGAGLSGWKYGAGTRIYPLRHSKVSPMIGAYFYHAQDCNPSMFQSIWMKRVIELLPTTLFSLMAV